MRGDRRSAAQRRGVRLAVSGQVDGQHRSSPDVAARDAAQRVDRSVGVMQQQHRHACRVVVAAQAQLTARHAHEVLAHDAPQRRGRGRRTDAVTGMALDEAASEVERLVGRAAGPYGHLRGGAADARQRLRQHIARGRGGEQRCAGMPQRLGAAQRERGAIADAVVVPRPHEVERGVLQRRGRRHVDRQSRGGRRAVPREEDLLLAQPRPQPGEVGAVPRRAERRQVVLDEVVAFLVRQQHHAVGDRA